MTKKERRRDVSDFGMGGKQMKIEEIRKMEIDVIKSLDNYSDYELVEIKRIADKMKEMAMYEEFFREKEETNE